VDIESFCYLDTLSIKEQLNIQIFMSQLEVVSVEHRCGNPDLGPSAKL
jgi:hypothetical protein